MRSITKSMALALIAGAAFPAMAQDSVSTNPDGGNGLPGDALSAFDANQCRAYIVDLTPFETSKGTRFGIAPIMKTSRGASAFFNDLSSAQSVSPDLLQKVQYPNGGFGIDGYELWNQPGFGVNRQNNNIGVLTSPTGASNQMAASFTTFATNDGGFNQEGLISCLINYNPGEPSRLFVTRVQGAITNPSNNAPATAALGGVSIDANGNNYVRADNFGANGPNPVAGNNLFRVNIDMRNCSMVNQISGGATFNATDALAINDPGVLVAPNQISESVFGPPGAVSSASFNNEWVRGPAPALTRDTTQLGASETRGTIGGTPKRPLQSGIWTHGQLNVDAAGNATVLNIWSATAGLAVAEKHALTPPPVVSDPCDPYDLNTAVGIFSLYQSQAAFRGSTGQVAVGADGAGRGLAAATFDEFDGGNDSPFNHILVARFNEDASSVAWTLAAWTDSGASGAGKPICDENGNPIGVLTYLSNIPGAPTGPSMSSPAIDGVGNVWFLSAVELFDRIDTNGDTIPDASDFDTALIRAIYDPANFCYSLELVVELGQVFRGQNSDTNWQIQFLEIADSNSVSSGGFFSSNVRSFPWDDASAMGMDPADPKSNGGVVLAAQIVYDVDGDGDFENPTSAGGNPASRDEAYRSMLFIGQAPEDGCNPADLAEPFGVLNFDDVIAFLNAFSGMDPAADLAVPFGVFNFDDVIAFLGAFSAGCP